MAFGKKNFYAEQNQKKVVSQLSDNETENVSTKNTLSKKEEVSSKKDKKNKKGSKTPIPQTAQDTIPYVRAYKNGMIETEVGFFTKAYKLKDINFKIAPQEVQEQIYLKYEEFLNSFDANVKFQIVLNNHSVDEKEVLKSVMIKPQADNLNDLREEYNQVLTDKLAEGRNNIANENYIIVGTECKSADEAKTVFSRIDSTVQNGLKAVVNDLTYPMEIGERIKMLHDICNLGHENDFVETDLENIYRQGLSSKDIIAPSGFKFEGDYFIMGDKYARVIFLKKLPSSLSTELTEEITAQPFNVTTSIYYDTFPQDKAVKFIKNKLLNINQNVMDAQKRAIKSNYSPELISHELMEAQNQTKLLLEDITKRNQKLFFVTIAVMHYADSLEELNSQTETLMALGNRFLVSFNKLPFQQEIGFTSALPLCNNKLSVKRALTTETAALFFPFSTQELMQDGGMYYGLNATSKNLILLNRLALKNQNGLIFGISGSGKSFSAKREMLHVLLNTKDDVYVIDPEGEYTELANALPEDSEVVKIGPGMKTYLNPFDMDLNYAKNDDGTSEDPVALKSDFIYTLCETIMGNRIPLTPNQKTIINRCTRKLYEPYLEHMRKVQETHPEITQDLDVTPTLDDFYTILMSQTETEARNIALAIELYARGSFDNFAHRTNINTKKRFVVFNIKNLGVGMKELGLQVCLNHIWNKIISNNGCKNTWFYIDEFYILTQQESSAVFLQQIFKRARKWGGVITGITQNVEDLLQTVAGRGILGNCDFIYMLSQAATDRFALQELYNISDAQLAYITDAGSGTGLIYNGSAIIPFIDAFPQNTKLYKIMNTKKLLKSKF